MSPTDDSDRSTPRVIYYLPGLVPGAPKRNVIMLLVYLLVALVGLDLMWPLL